MARQKGSPKYGGRTKGTPNLTTKQAREILNQILFAELNNIREALNEIRLQDKKEYLNILSKLLVFSLPKKSDITSDDEGLSPAINITVASSEVGEELKEFLDESSVI